MGQTVIKKRYGLVSQDSQPYGGTVVLHAACANILLGLIPSPDLS